MRAFPTAPSAVRLTVDEGALVIGLLDFLVEPTMRASPDVVGLAQRTRRRVSAALAAAITDTRADIDTRFEHLREEFFDLQAAFREQTKRVEESLEASAEIRSIARRIRSLVGDVGPLTIGEGDDRLLALREELARLAA